MEPDPVHWKLLEVSESAVSPVKDLGFEGIQGFL